MESTMNLTKRIRSVKERVKRAGRKNRKIKFKTNEDRNTFLSFAREIACSKSDVTDFNHSGFFVVIRMRHYLYTVTAFGDLHLSVSAEKIPFETRNSFTSTTPTENSSEG
ncbi:hypothetical protein [Bdellovibrio bacteriovorus]|uniref:hypothetical protein n=1 Tax=Bdellovibrio bacteriovorus TaxID=959 RepID=UPI003AA94A2E